MAVKPVKVSQLNAYIKRVLQADPLLSSVSVIGEISNIKFHGTGHVYFTLKDENSKISCFLPSEHFQRLRFELADGMEITAEGYIYLYEKGGTYSLNIRDIQVAGLGNLSIAFERLKEKLFKEGLFDEKYKKPIPLFPHKIAVITSETGAAVKDILKIIKNRNNIVDVLIYPVLVQGPGAAPDIAQAIRQVNLIFPEIDTIIVGRGGGSIEELWAFNEEIVARSIFESKIPVISAVGHEIDFTIADFVADRRAETPTAAAQIAVPDVFALREYVTQLGNRLHTQMSSLIRHKELELRYYNREVMALNLEKKVQIYQTHLEHHRKELSSSMNQIMSSKRSKVDGILAELEALSPRNIMKRGYSAIIGTDGRLKNSIFDFKMAEKVTAVLADGNVDCIVEEIREEE